MRLALVDAYDSFTHNLAQAFESLGADVVVLRCDETDAAELLALDPALVVFGPGPGRPAEAGCVLDAVEALLGVVPILGVCLGHQALAEALGGHLLRHPPVHGHASRIHHDGTSVFEGLPPAVAMTRYHSLVVDPAALPSGLRINAWSEDGAVMGLAHEEWPAWGVQFHPESVLSGEPGRALLRNALGRGAGWAARPQPPRISVARV